MLTDSGLTDTELARLLGRDPSAPKWDRLLVEPEHPEPREPGTDAPMAERFAYWQEREQWATSSAEHAVPVSALAACDRSTRTRGSPFPPRAPAPAPPRTHSVLVREVLARDEAGRIAKTKEYEVTESIEPSKVTG